MKAYIEIPALSKEAFKAVEKAHNALLELKKYLPDAQYYTTCFVYDGKVYHTDTQPSSEGNSCSLQKMYHKIGTVLDELPVIKEIVEIEKHTGISEQLFLRSISAASHRYLTKE